MWIKANPNPCRREEPDCVVRAIAIATDQTWQKVHRDLCRLSYEQCTMPSVNWLYHALKSAETFYAMKDADEWEMDAHSGRCYSGRDGDRSYRRGRDSMGRYTIRDMGPDMSGHYPEWMPPYYRY